MKKTKEPPQVLSLKRVVNIICREEKEKNVTFTVEKRFAKV